MIEVSCKQLKGGDISGHQEDNHYCGNWRDGVTSAAPRF